MDMRYRRSGRRLSRPRFMKLVQPKFMLLAFLIICWQGSSETNANSNHVMNFRYRTPANSPFEENANIETEAMGGSPVALTSDETAIAGPFVGNIVRDLSEPKKKKSDCSMPPISQRGERIVSPALKRSYFAYTPEEMEEKIREEEGRQKREVKRNEISDGPLPWTCETKYEWKDMGAEHYPRFVRTAECKSRVCFNGFFRCRPRRYKTKVLKKLSGQDSASCEEDDVSLPETLRSSWRFITVTINLCCDCTGRIPGTVEI